MAAENSKQKSKRRFAVLLGIGLLLCSCTVSLVFYHHGLRVEACKAAMEAAALPQTSGTIHKLVSWVMSWSRLQEDPEILAQNTVQTDLCHAGFFYGLYIMLSHHVCWEIYELAVNFFHGIQSETFITHIPIFVLILTIFLIVTILILRRHKRLKSKNSHSNSVCDPNPNMNYDLTVCTPRIWRDDYFDKVSKTDFLKQKQVKESCRQFLPRASQWIFGLVLTAASVSIPWEFARLYQNAVAVRAAKILKGTPEECSPKSLNFAQSLKSFLQFCFSWSHGDDPCYEYHYALLVDPLWEVSPLLVVSSVFTRCLVHPVELILSAAGRGFRSFFSEIPIQWQPVIMLVTTATGLVLLLMLCRYRLSIPLFLRIEPKTPVQSPAHDKRKGADKTFTDCLTRVKQIGLKHFPGESNKNVDHSNTSVEHSENNPAESEFSVQASKFPRIDKKQDHARMFINKGKYAHVVYDRDNHFINTGGRKQLLPVTVSTSEVYPLDTKISDIRNIQEKPTILNRLPRTKKIGLKKEQNKNIELGRSSLRKTRTDNQNSDVLWVPSDSD